MSTPSQTDHSQSSIATMLDLVQFHPHQFLFTPSKIAPGQVAKIKLKNLTSTTTIGYKFKTNAPLKYSVKPVLGALAPGETVKVYVRSESWISPQDKFLLQTVALTEQEGQSLDPRIWKTLNRNRFSESYIPCCSSSALSLRDPEDDPGSLSSTSSTISPILSPSHTPPFHPYDLARLPTPQHRPRQQVFERWQYAEAMRPTVSVGGLGRRLSTASSSACSSATSPLGSYPTLFTPRSSEEPGSPTKSTASAMSSKRSSFSFSATLHPPFASVVTEVPSTDASIELRGYSKNDFESFKDKLTTPPPSKVDNFATFAKANLLFLSLLGLYLILWSPFERYFDSQHAISTS